jgi:4-aminobutyrate--pyruvate transaminase
MRPQMMSLAKALSSAYVPLSAAVIPGAMYEALVEPVSKVGVFGHGYTYSGHPVACAVASKVLEIYQRDRLFEHAANGRCAPAGAPCGPRRTPAGGGGRVAWA